MTKDDVMYYLKNGVVPDSTMKLRDTKLSDFETTNYNRANYSVRANNTDANKAIPKQAYLYLIEPDGTIHLSNMQYFDIAETGNM